MTCSKGLNCRRQDKQHEAMYQVGKDKCLFLLDVVRCFVWNDLARDIKICVTKSSVWAVTCLSSQTLALAMTKVRGGPNELNSPPPSCEWLERGRKAGTVRKSPVYVLVPDHDGGRRK